MKIVDLTEFLRLPPGTLYAKYEPCVFESLAIKSENCSHTKDWFYSDIVYAIACNSSDEMFDLLDHSQKHGSSIPMDFEITSRDGCFEDDQLFAVFERADVEQLIEKLKGTLTILSRKERE